MIEIGLNLKDVIIDFINKNLKCGYAPGHLFKEAFGKLIDEATNRESETIRGDCTGATATVKCTKEYPTKSGYYWYINNWDHKVIIYYCDEYKYFAFIGDNTQYNFKFMKLLHGRFVQPINPIPKPD